MTCKFQVMSIRHVVVLSGIDNKICSFKVEDECFSDLKIGEADVLLRLKKIVGIKCQEIFS